MHKEKILRIKEIMKELTSISYELSPSLQNDIKNVCEELKEVCEILDY